MDKKELCCLCFNKFNLEDLTAMPDGGSGACCEECKEKVNGRF
tara:strand:- start:199 stop:327 length:129 start_codon:yes stop_codon:yes gene_type:complete